ncbi:MAG: dihydrolipoyllysine-residue acetyltransferase [Xanthomonadales bacterium]|jgi:pyruvate dehydrogenase E2 component (dihydrolipoamide acetyltransferase)|nr:dihydrolipoyllysine-residue acetyltransferase [Xanthomonadales bacterium]
MSQIEIIKVPDIGDFDSVEIIEVLVAEGDSINVDDVIITLESEKATLEVPSPASGVIKKVLVKLGDSVSQGTDMLELEISESTDKEPKAVDETAKVEKTEQAKVEKPTKTETAEMPKEVTRKPPPVTLQANNLTGKKAHASPAIRKFARELGADINLIPGTGRKGRITKNDVKSFIKQAMQSGGTVQSGASNFDVLPPVNEDFSKYGDIESVSLSRIQKISGKYLHRNWVRIPHVTQFDEADITELEQFRQDSKDEAKAQGFGLSPLAFIVKAVAVALKKFPKFNSSLDAAEENLIMKKYYHIGIAVDTPNGLVVPVIRDVLGKTVMEIAREMSELSVKARDGKLAPSDMKGGCFSVSSLGGIGGTAFTPIINSPEVAILGVSRSQIKPVFNDKGEVKPRLMLPLSLSYDHRVIDGADAARFIVYLSTVLSDLKKMLL